MREKIKVLKDVKRMESKNYKTDREREKEKELRGGREREREREHNDLYNILFKNLLLL